ncbi:MAG: RNA polymerase sigma factor [Saprospiraceae bacterium]
MANQRAAQRQLYEACAPYVFTIVKNYIRDEHFRKDAMQEAFAHIFTSLKNYDANKGNFKNWIARITVNRCAVLLKRTINFNLRPEEEGGDIASENVFAYLDQLTKRDIEQMLQKMPAGYRTIFLMSVMDGYSHKEIGMMLNIAPETSRSQLLRATKWIKKNILPDSKEFFLNKDLTYGIR